MEDTGGGSDIIWPRHAFSQSEQSNGWDLITIIHQQRPTQNLNTFYGVRPGGSYTNIAINCDSIVSLLAFLRQLHSMYILLSLPYRLLDGNLSNKRRQIKPTLERFMIQHIDFSPS